MSTPTDRLFISVTDSDGTSMVLNLDHISGITKLPDGNAQVWWVGDDEAIALQHTFEEMEEVLKLAKARVFTPGKPRPPAVFM